jgi:hypothetical protein
VVGAPDMRLAVIAGKSNRMKREHKRIWPGIRES